MPHTRIGSRSQDHARRGFIRAYGLFWGADEIQWSRDDENRDPFRMLGRIGKRGPNFHVCDFRDQRGIYVLYSDHGPYYVGLVRVGTLGNRLKQHRSDGHEGEWDRFSWFGFSKVLLTGRPYADGTRALGNVADRLLTDSRWAIRDLEALLIQSLGTEHRGNSSLTRFAQGEHWEQVRRNEADHYLDRLAKPMTSRGTRPREPSRRRRATS